jgi:restriction endonuclease S subunit
VRSRFLWYWLNAPFISAHTYGFRDGSVPERLNLPSIRGLPVLVPSTDEQIAIETLTAPLDDKVDLSKGPGIYTTKCDSTDGRLTRIIFREFVGRSFG